MPPFSKASTCLIVHWRPPKQETQNIMINTRELLERDVTYYIALRAFDEAGNAGSSSNIVALVVPKELPIGLPIFILLAAIAVCIILLAIVVGVVIFLVNRKKYQNYEAPHNSNEYNQETSVVPGSQIIICAPECAVYAPYYGRPVPLEVKRPGQFAPSVKM